MIFNIVVVYFIYNINHKIELFSSRNYLGPSKKNIEIPTTLISNQRIPFLRVSKEKQSESGVIDVIKGDVA